MEFMALGFVIIGNRGIAATNFAKDRVLAFIIISVVAGTFIMAIPVKTIKNNLHY
jgi:hypothetical protein